MTFNIRNHKRCLGVRLRTSAATRKRLKMIIPTKNDALLQLLPEPPLALFAVLPGLEAYLEKLEGSPRCLRGMRVARADIAGDSHQ